jgi:hypothetical protein
MAYSTGVFICVCLWPIIEKNAGKKEVGKMRRWGKKERVEGGW